MTRLTATFHEDRCPVMITACCFILRTRNVSDKKRRENQITHLRFNFYINLSVLEATWKNMIDRHATDNTWSMRFAFWITNARGTHLEYVIHIALLLQHWLHELPSMLY